MLEKLADGRGAGQAQIGHDAADEGAKLKAVARKTGGHDDPSVVGDDDR